MKTGSSPASRLGRGQVSFVPVFSRTAAYAAQHIAQFPQIRYDSVRVVLRGYPDTSVVVKDTSVFFNPQSADFTLDLTVAVQADGQRFYAGMDYRGPEGVVFHGSATVQSHPPDGPAPAQQTLLLNYVGPGARVRSISVSPKTITLLGVQTTTLSVTASDSSGANTTPPPVSWSSSNTTIAAVTAAGAVQGLNRRGSATITALSPTGLTDNATVNVVLPAASIALVSGGGQSGKAGAALAAPGVVQVNAVDGVGVAGVPVVFAAPAGGGVGSASVVTDANGRASTTLRLGSAAGPQSFAATAAGFSVGIPATATAADPAAIAIVAGNNQADTIRATLGALSVRVADQFDNPVSGAPVSWTRTAGAGTLGGASSVTNADGVATNTYTLGGAAGSEAVTASIGAASVGFAFTARAGSPAVITAVSGNNQTGRVLQSLSVPLVVRVVDAGGNAAAGGIVRWSATNGSIVVTTTVDASGQSANTLTLGASVGTATATAALANGQRVSFSAAVQAGAVSNAIFSAQPANGTANATLAPVRVSLRDAGGNVTPVNAAVSLALGANGTGATLAGTLTRNAVNGVATFDDLRIDRAGSGYTLVASNGSITAVTSAAFNIAAGSASALAIVAGNGQSATVHTAVAAAPSVKVTDAANNPIPGVAITFAASGNGVVAPAGGVVTTNAQGVAALTSWTLGTVAGAQQLVASGAGLTSVTFSATAVPAAAFRMTLTNKVQLQASANSGAALSPQPAVQLFDQYGNFATSGALQVNASVSGAGVTLQGATSLSASPTTGAVAFSGLSLNGSGTARIVVSEPGGVILPDTSAAIAVTAASPTQLVLVPASPTTISAAAGGTVTSPQLKVADASGNGVAGVPVHFVVDTGSAPHVAVIALADYASAADGLVTFDQRLPTRTGVYHITATSASVPNASVVVTVVIVPGSASRIAFATQPAAGITDVPMAVNVQLQDALGNVATASAVPVTLSIASGPTGATMTGGGPMTSANGNATFNVSFNAAGTYTLLASSLPLTAATSVAFTVAAQTGPTPASIVANGAASNLTATVGTTTATAPSVTIRDAQQNPVAGTPVNFAITGGGGSILSPAGGTPVTSLQVLTNGQGVASVGAWTLGTTAGANSLAASVTGAGSATFTATGLAGPARSLSLSSGGGVTPSGQVRNRSAFASAARVQIVDQYGNVSRQANRPIVAEIIAPLNLTGAPALTAPLPTLDADAADTVVSDANGVADFTGRKRPRGRVQNFRLRFSVTVDGATYTTTTDNISLRAGDPASLSIGASDSLPRLHHRGASLAKRPKVTVQDPDGNLVDNTSVTFAANRGSLAGSATAATDANGAAEGPAWTLPNGDFEDNHITATAGGVTLVMPDVVSTWPTKVKIRSAMTGNAFANGGRFGTTVLELRDAQGRTVPLSGRSVRARGNGGGTANLPVFNVEGDSVSASDTSGTIRFSNLTADAVQHPSRRLVFVSDDGWASDSSDAFAITPGAGRSFAIQGQRTHVSSRNAAFQSVPKLEVRDYHGRNTASTTHTFNWTAGSGCPAGAITGGTSATQDGIAALTLGTATSHGSCTLTATDAAGAMTGSQTFELVVKPKATSKYWTGAIDDDWSKGDNWSDGAAPTSASDVFVPKIYATNKPKLGATSAANDVVVETGTQLDVRDRTLTVGGDVDAGGAIVSSNGGRISLVGSAKTLKGTLPTVEVGAGTGGTSCTESYVLAGEVTATAMTVNCALTINSRKLTLTVGLQVSTDGGVVNMNAAADSVIVGGDARFAGKSSTSSLTNGLLVVRGSLAQSGSGAQFAPNGSHELKLSGTAGQTVSFASSASGANNLTVSNTSVAGVTFATDATVGGRLTTDAGSRIRSAAGKTVTVAGQASISGKSNGLARLQATGTSFPTFSDSSADTVLVTGVTRLAANRSVTGDLRVGGEVDLGGYALSVGGNLTVSGTNAKIRMLSTTPTSYLTVGGRATFSGVASATDLEAGTIEPRGDFVENGVASDAFSSGTALLVKFGGNGLSSGVPQSVSFVTANAGHSTQSHFGKLEIGTTALVKLLNDVFVDAEIDVRGKLNVAAKLDIANQADFRLHGGSTVQLEGRVVGGTCKRNSTTPATITGTNGALLSRICPAVLLDP